MGRDWETEKERTRGERETRRFREMERDKKTEREREREMLRQRGTDIWGEITRKGEPETQKREKRSGEWGCQPLADPCPTASEEGKGRDEKDRWCSHHP